MSNKDSLYKDDRVSRLTLSEVTCSAINIDNDKTIDEINAKNFYITIPWSPQMYFTVRGAENLHIYLWIAKDFCWIQDFEVLAMIFGSLALAWCGVLLYHAIEARDIEEVYMLIALTLWLFGNFWWMRGEVVFGDDDTGAPTGGHVFETAMGMIILYHLILRPFGIIKMKPGSAELYESVGKDWSWDLDIPYTWVIFVIPTLLIAIDFIYLTAQTKTMTIDVAHYAAQTIWVSANIIWAGAEVFGASYDSAYYIFHVSHNAQLTARWYSSWLLFFAYLPIFILYAVWLPLTCTGRIQASNIPNPNKRASLVNRLSLFTVSSPSIYKDALDNVITAHSPIVDSKRLSFINENEFGLNRIDMELVNQAFAYVDKISKDDDDDYELTENIDLESIDQKQSTSRLFKLKEKSEIDSLKSPGSQGISVYLPKSAPSIHGSDSKTKLLTNRLNNLLNYQTSTYIDTNRKSRAQEFDLSVNSESDKLSSTDFQNIIKNLETGSEVERLREELAKSEKSLANTLEIIKQLSDQKNL
eukprot:gene20172-26187_t